MEHNHPHGDASTCAICRNQHEFEFPAELFKSFLAREVVIFAGAGISTENRLVYPFTFYEDICNELTVEPEDGLSFPDLMSRYCAQPNGRRTLLHKIKQRLDYVKSFPELHDRATRFHRELSTIFQIDTIVTTNWDTYFEQECGATPFVSADDFAFWNLPGRKVFKLHGSVDSYGSIVATREDYEACYERLSTGLLGSSLKLMLATKTLLYIGFSFTDDDFLRIHEILSTEMQGLRPHSYIVTLDRNADARLKEHGLTPIYTDGTYFLSVLKEHMIQEKCFIPDERFYGIMPLLSTVFLAMVN